MRTILIFGDDEQEGAVLAQQAADWYGVVTELDRWLRSEIKYGQKNELQLARDMLHDLVQGSRLTLD